jgi:oxalate decarboxylase/phosphoglucose isomerase-like protein (cupin superfamily)
MTTYTRYGNDFPYDYYMRGEGIPIYSAMGGVDDITHLPRGDWARTGGKGTFIQLDGTFQSQRGLYVGEIPGGGAMNPEKHLYEEEIFILEGRGLTEVWQDEGKKISFEWGEGSVFAIPRNISHRLINGSREPAIFLAVTTAPEVHNVFNDLEFIYNSSQKFINLYGNEEYFVASDIKTIEGRFNEVQWHTNFIPSALNAFVDNLEQKVAGGQLTGYRMGERFPHGHISEWPGGRYHKAHYHGPGAVLLGLSGKGYVNLWPRELGTHPYKDGHGDQVITVEWGPKSIYSPPDGYFHQHLNTSNEPARHIAVYGGQIPLGVHRMGDEEFIGYIPLSEGGTLIPYEDEDPEIRRLFEERCRKNGVEPKMPPVTYRN